MTHHDTPMRFVLPIAFLVCLGALGLGSPSPAPPLCRVQTYTCQSGNPPCNSAQLRYCELGTRNASTGESGYLQNLQPQTVIRKCYKFAQTTTWDCNSTPPGGGWTKLPECGQSDGQCCFGKVKEVSHDIENSLRELLSHTPCTGTGGGGQ